MNKSTKNSEPFIFLFKKSWQFAGELRTKYIISLICSIMGTIPYAVIPLIIAVVINEIQGVGITPDNAPRLLFITSLILVARLLHSFFRFVGAHYGIIVSIGVENTYKEYLLEGFTKLGLNWHSGRDSGSSIDKIRNSTNGLRDFVYNLEVDIHFAVGVVTGLVAVLYFDLFAGVVVILAFSIIGYCMYLYSLYLATIVKQINKIGNKVSAKIFDIVSNITSIIILRAQKPACEDMSRAVRQTEYLRKKFSFLNNAKQDVLSVSLEFILVGVLIYFIYAAGYIGIEHEAGYIVALYLYVTRTSIFLRNGVNSYGKYIKIKVDIENSETIERDFVDNPQDMKLIKNFSEVKISNLNFFYSDDEEKISGLKDVNLTIKKSERIAVVGPSGTGKTTLLKVINGLYEGAHCDLTVDGKESKDIDLSEYDLGTMLIPQEPEIFSASIRENITFCSDYPESDIEDAIKLAEFGEVVSRLPKGLESKIHEKGVNLSGGEKQRLALARGLLVSQGKSILLLDEATSSVDSKNEVKIYKNILDKFADKSVVATIHKLNLLRFFDKIVIFKNGAVVGVGTFEELLQSNKDFKRDWEQYITKKEHEHQTESEE